jgi:mannan endo-1,6-alpha-mannosidase
MNALSILMYTLVESAKGPVTSKTGGTSKGNPGGGNTDINDNDGTPPLKDITTADKAGAGILTFLFLAGVIGGVSFLVIDF